MMSQHLPIRRLLTGLLIDAALNADETDHLARCAYCLERMIDETARIIHFEARAACCEADEQAA